MLLRNLFLGSALLLSVGLISCSETATEEKTTEQTAAEQAETDAMLMHTSPATPGATSAQSATVISPQAGQQANPATPNTATQPAKTVAGMNPPHGEPGHDCNIAVGAPLK